MKPTQETRKYGYYQMLALARGEFGVMPGSLILALSGVFAYLGASQERAADAIRATLTGLRAVDVTARAPGADGERCLRGSGWATRFRTSKGAPTMSASGPCRYESQPRRERSCPARALLVIAYVAIP
ncbi:MAG: hypothetical protein MUF54_07610 [Polyangiaceae bacterium]|jgi:hypothetical protein|nr:hypothetical protein [Polyangiaceae bacterium]